MQSRYVGAIRLIKIWQQNAMIKIPGGNAKQIAKYFRKYLQISSVYLSKTSLRGMALNIGKMHFGTDASSRHVCN